MKTSPPAFHQEGETNLYHRDALDILATLPDASFDGIVTDPPYCSGGMTAGERTRLASVKYVQNKQKVQWPEFEGESMDQNAGGG
jgi:site-specific DNA-methyltransferase (adenine-specific)